MDTPPKAPVAKKATAKKSGKKRQNRPADQLILDRINALSYGDLAKLPAKLVDADIDVARFLCRSLTESIKAADDAE